MVVAMKILGAGLRQKPNVICGVWRFKRNILDKPLTHDELGGAVIVLAEQEWSKGYLRPSPQVVSVKENRTFILFTYTVSSVESICAWANASNDFWHALYPDYYEGMEWGESITEVFFETAEYVVP